MILIKNKQNATRWRPHVHELLTLTVPVMQFAFSYMKNLLNLSSLRDFEIKISSYLYTQLLGRK